MKNSAKTLFAFGVASFAIIVAIAAMIGFSPL